jgi:hypothetical protein
MFSPFPNPNWCDYTRYRLVERPHVLKLVFREDDGESRTRPSIARDVGWTAA